MAAIVERSAQDSSSPKDVGRNLRQVRKQQGLSRGAAARSAGLTRRELAAYERGKVEVPESDLWCLAGSCGVDVSELLPRREPLHVSADLSTISTGDTIRHLRGPAEPEGVLREYLAMIYALRNLAPGTPVPLRQPDLAALADALGGTPDAIEHRLIELVGASPTEAARLRAMILPPLSLPATPSPDTPRVDPYAALGQPATSPAVEQFFANPPDPDVVTPAAPFASPSPFAAPPASYTPAAPAPSSLDGPVASPADQFAASSPTPTSGPTPSDPFAGPVDLMATAAATVWDPFEPPSLDDPLAPPPLPPDPFAAAPVSPPGPVAPSVDDPSRPGPVADTVSPFGVNPSDNGHQPLVDDPFAPRGATEGGPVDPPATSASLGINVMDAIVVDDPVAEAVLSDPFGVPPAASVTSPPVDVLDHHSGGLAEPAGLVDAPAVSRIAWNADIGHAAAVDASTPTPVADTTPRFERASAHWQIGGVFPATATADDGTLALRRADARWALTDLRASENCIIEAAFDFRAGSGFGVMFRSSLDEAKRISGYSFDIDPIASGGGYLLRVWEDSRQHWRPLAQTPLTDATQLYGHHVVRLAQRADQLTVSVDGDTVLDVPALSRSTIELGRQPCRGDRVGIQAWSTSEVTVESFQVASL